jgi:hypothetical protein
LLRAFLLAFQRLPEELDHVLGQVPGHFLWHSMVDELRTNAIRSMASLLVMIVSYTEGANGSRRS